MVFTSDGRIIM